jgi:hypothetical protein
MKKEKSTSIRSMRPMSPAAVDFKGGNASADSLTSLNMVFVPSQTLLTTLRGVGCGRGDRLELGNGAGPIPDGSVWKRGESEGTVGLLGESTGRRRIWRFDHFNILSNSVAKGH